MEKDKTMSMRDRYRRQKKRKILLSAFLILFCFIAVSVLIIRKVFTVKTVVVEGNEHYSDSQIENIILSDEYSWNSLYMLLKYRFLEGEEIPFVEELEVSLDNPHTLRVHVYEKGIIGYLYISSISQNAYFDTDGFVAETSKEVIPDIPQVEGLDCDKVVLYEKLPIKDEDVLKSLLTVTRSLQKKEIIPQKIKFGSDDDISLEYGGIQVLLGRSDNLTQKILRLSYILPELSGKKGVLHMESWTENTTNIIFDEIE